VRVVALEEHFTVPALVKRIDPEAARRRGFRPRTARPTGPSLAELLPDMGEKRLASMDAAGITVEVLSNTGPGPDLVPGAEGIAVAREMNDHLAAAVARQPSRFAGFAVLPMQSPDACADELRRAVRDLRFVGALINGTTEGRFLDHPSYDGLLAAAVELDVPIYIHPHLAPEPVRQAYYSDLPTGASRVIEQAGWGWHSETAIHLLRLVVAGVLDRHPRLKLIIGHMGRHRPPAAADQPHHSRSGLDHHQRHVLGAAAARRAPDLRHRPHHVLGGLSLLAPRQGPGLPGPHRARPGRHGEVHARQRRCAAEAEVGQWPLEGRRALRQRV
jgi:predicted TIM-barrel fold metal-dependent hydrolase